MCSLVKLNITVTPEFLAERGYSISRAAAAVGVSVTHLCLVLKGERKPSAALLQRLRFLPKCRPVKPRVSYGERER